MPLEMSSSQISLSRENSMPTIGTPSGSVIGNSPPTVDTNVPPTTATPNHPPLERGKATDYTENESKALIEEIKVLAVQLRTDGHENKKLLTIKGSEELLKRIDEILQELEEQYQKIILAMKTSHSVIDNLFLLKTSMIEIDEFYNAVTAAWMFTSKSRLKLRMQNHYQTLRARCTQLLTAVSLELLTSKPVEIEQTPVIASELYHNGIYYFYGLHNRPKNYIYAFEKFIQGAELQDAHCLYMAGICYLSGYGVDEDRNHGLHLLERSANIGGCPAAKTEIAKQILRDLKLKDPKSIKKYFYLDAPPTFGPLTNGPPTSASVLTRQSSQPLNIPSWNPDPTSRRKHQDLQQTEVDDNGPLTINTAADEKTEYDNADDYPVDAAAELVHHDIQYAMKLLLDAASEGHIEAKTELGIIYEEIDDNEQAAKWYSLASNGGCSKGTCQLGILLFFSKANYVGTKPKAFSLFSMAAKNGQPDAYNGLGLCYEAGVGTESNLSLAIVNYRLGAKLGSSQAMYNLGYLLVKNAIEVLDDRKDKEGKLQQRGQRQPSPSRSHMPSSPVRKADFELFSELGIRVEDALSEGIHWLRAASENRVADAAFQLGRLYEQSLGVPFDEQAALENYLFASELGHPRATLFAGNLLYKLTNENSPHYSKNMLKVGKLYGQAAKMGVIDAMNSYAILLEDGRASSSGIRDVYAAAAWYYEACRQAYIPAFLNLAILLASESIFSFTTLRGEMMTLPKVLEFLEERLPMDSIDEERFQSFQAYLHSAKERSSQPQTNVVGNEESNHVERDHHWSEGMLVSKEKPDLLPQHHLHASYTSDVEAERTRQSIELWRHRAQKKHQEQLLSQPEVRVEEEEEGGGGNTALVLADEREIKRTSLRSNKPINPAHNKVSISDVAAFNPKEYYGSTTSYYPPPPSQNYYDRMKEKLSSSNTPSPQLRQSFSNAVQLPPPQQLANDRKVTFPTVQTQPKQYVNITFPAHNRYNNSTYAGDEKSSESPMNTSLVRSGELYMTNGAIPPPVYVPKPLAPEKPSNASKPRLPAGSLAQQNGFISPPNPTNTSNTSVLSNIPPERTSQDYRSSQESPGKKEKKRRDYSPKRKDTVTSGNITLDQQYAHLQAAEAQSEETKRNSLSFSLWNKMYKQTKNDQNQRQKSAATLSASSNNEGEEGIVAAGLPHQHQHLQQHYQNQRYSGGHGPPSRENAQRYETNDNTRNNFHHRDMGNLSLNVPDLN